MKYIKYCVKTNNKKYSIFFLFISITSCINKQEKFVQAEIDKIGGNWAIDNLMMPANAPDTLKNFFKKGELLFNSCKYSSKSSSSCSGEAEINNVIIGVPFSYVYNSSLFKWQLTYSNNDGFRSGSSKAQQIFDGSWEVTIDGNKMTAKRKDAIKSYGGDQATLYKGEVMFTATKK